MSVTPEFPGPEYHDLFGINRTDLDALAEAERQAEDGRITLREWREVYSDVLGQHSGAADGVSHFVDEWMDRCTAIRFARDGSDIPTAWVQLGEEDRKERADGLFAHLSGLCRPPADQDLQRLFAEADERERAARAKDRPEMVELCADRMQVVGRWIAETDGVPRDPWSGLPVDRIERCRWVQDDVLGRVPVSFRAAMAQAWLAADADERQLAASLGNGPNKSETDWKTTHAFSALAGTVLSEFFRWLAESSDPSAAAVMHEWHHGALPQLVQEYLDHRG